MIEVVLEGPDVFETPAEELDNEASLLSQRPSPLGRVLARVRALPHLGIWLGVVLAAGGGVLLVVAWGGTAGLTNVGLQIPYLVSAGFTGLGLIAVGMTCISVAAKRADAKLRTGQIAELRALLTELRSVLQQEQK